MTPRSLSRMQLSGSSLASATTVRKDPAVWAASASETTGSSDGATRTVTFCCPRTLASAVFTIARMRSSRFISPRIFLTDCMTTSTTVPSMPSMNSTLAMAVSMTFSMFSRRPASRPSA